MTAPSFVGMRTAYSSVVKLAVRAAGVRGTAISAVCAMLAGRESRTAKMALPRVHGSSLPVPEPRFCQVWRCGILRAKAIGVSIIVGHVSFVPRLVGHVGNVPHVELFPWTDTCQAPAHQLSARALSSSPLASPVA